MVVQIQVLQNLSLWQRFNSFIFFRLSGLPISENRESRRSGTERGVELSTIQRTPEEIRPVSHTPPPAYDDIFPKEYVYNINATNSSSE